MIEKTFKAKLHRGVRFLYTLLLLIPFWVFYMILKFESLEGTEFYLVIIPFLLVPGLILGILIRAHKIRFEVTDDDQIFIHGVFTNHKISIEDIEVIQRVAGYKMGFRIMGATFLGGLYYFPKMGFTWVATGGNIQNQVFLKMKKGKHHLISPDSPEEFIEMIKSKISK